MYSLSATGTLWGLLRIGTVWRRRVTIRNDFGSLLVWCDDCLAWRGGAAGVRVSDNTGEI
jgi:hypothetical protein